MRLPRQKLTFLMPLGLLAAAMLAFAWHIAVGAKTVPLLTVFQAFFAFDPSVFDHIVVRELRLPRALSALLTGAALATAGALMQGVTRNPLAEPGILGVMSGAAFAVVVSVGFLHWVSPLLMPLAAAIGAMSAALIIWGMATLMPGGATPLVLVLCGAMVSTLFGAFITIIHLVSEDSFQQLRVWLSGALTTPQPSVLTWVLPWIGIGLVLALSIARQVTALSMGQETAIGLGVNVAIIQRIALLAVIALTAGAVALAGPLGFVGLVIPHAVRLLVGSDYGRIIPYAAAVGAVYLLVVDTLARLIFAPLEIATGILTAVLGAPVFIWLIRARL